MEQRFENVMFENGSKPFSRGISDNHNDKLAMLAIKVRELVSLNHGYVSLNDMKIKSKLATKFDSLLSFLVSNFSAPVTAEDAREAMRRDKPVNILSEADLALMADGTIPIIVVRTLLAVHKLMVDPRNMDHWPKFVDRYQKPVMHA